MTTVGGVGPAAPPPRDERAELRQLAHQLEGVFIGQLFQAMRESTPDSGLIGSTPGGQMFTSLLDDRLASQAAERMKRGIGEALYRELVKRLPQADASSHGEPTDAVDPGSRRNGA